MGNAKRRRLRRKKEANPASLRSAAPSKGRGSRGHSLLPMEGGAPKGRRLDGESGMKERGEIVSSTPFARAPYPPLTRSPFPNGEGCDTRMLLFSHCQSEYTHMWKKQYRRTKPFPMGKAKRRRLRRPKRKPTPPRCARQPLPRERPLKNPLKNEVWNMLFGNRVTI